MEIRASRIDGANAKIEARIAQQTIAKKIDGIAKKLAGEMKLDGFRKGKVPVAIVKSRYGEKLLQDAEAEALKEVLNVGMKQLEIAAGDILGEPRIEKFEKGEKEIEARVVFGYRPAIRMDGYEAFVPEVKEPEVTEDEIKTRLKELAKEVAPFKKIEEERGLQKGDMSVIDFEGFIGEEPLEGGKAENFNLKIGSGQFIPGFEEQLEGMKVGEKRTIGVVFPQEYQNRQIAGKPATFHVSLKEIQAKEEIAIDEELAKKILQGEDDATLDKLREKVAEQIKTEKLSKLYNEELKPALVEALVEKFDFDLPNNIVEQEIDLAFRRKLQGMSKEEIEGLRGDEEKIKNIREELRKEAQKSVKATFIVDALAKKEGVDVSDHELMQVVYYEALSMRQNPKEVFEYYKKQGLLPAIKMAMIEDKLLSKLLDRKVKAA